VVMSLSLVGEDPSSCDVRSLTLPSDTRRGEILLGFYVRAGVWIDGIEILTSLGRKSGIFGNARGGSGYVLHLSSLHTLKRAHHGLTSIPGIH
jgi:hypothetical protein